MKRTYTLTIHIDKQIAEEYNKLAANYQNLSPQECQDFDFLTDAILDANSLLVPADDTSTIHWLPVNGTAPPAVDNQYIFTDGDEYHIAIWTDGYYVDVSRDMVVSKRYITHYAALPTFKPVQTIPDYITRHTCDGCGQPFTLEQWDERETPHEADCPCFDVDFADNRGDFACICDRNYHVGCYTDELRKEDNDTCDMLRVLHPDRYAYQEETL